MLGVSRNIPLSQLANMVWGDTVLVGTFHSYDQVEFPTLTKKDGSLRFPNGRKRNLGEARIECAFAVRDIMVKDPKVSQALADKIIQECPIEEVIPDQHRIVQRACGGYVIGTQYVLDGVDITTKIAHLYGLLLEVKKELNLEVVKVMIGGPVTHEFPAGTGLYDAKFTRGVVEIETSGFDFSKEYESEHDGRNKVVRIHKYEQVKSCKYNQPAAVAEDGT